MSNEEFEGFLERAAPEYNRPPEPPREEMWAEIRARRSERDRRERSMDLPARRARQERMRRLRRWTPWGLGIGIAATLAVGFGLGRISGDITRVPSSPVATAPADEAARSAAPSRSVQLAAAGHLGEAEAMLTFYRSAEGDSDRAATARWAQELLTTTRLLLDSRAGEDPGMASLLEDLELVLVQITAAGSGASEQGLIEEGMEQNQLLPKLRTASGGPLDMAL